MRVVTRKKKKCYFFIYKILAITVVFAVFLVFCDTRVRPTIKRKVRDIARTDSTYILNETLLSQINNLDIKYSDFVTIKTTDEGKISSVETNSLELNKFKALFALSVTRALREIEDFDFSISVGTLMGPEFLIERGPKIPFKVSSSEYVKTEIESRFEESGINQTVHKILLEVTVNVCCYFPGYSTSVNVDTELLLAETVIIGEVPKYYVN